MNVPLNEGAALHPLLYIRWRRREEKRRRTQRNIREKEKGRGKGGLRLSVHWRFSHVRARIDPTHENCARGEERRRMRRMQTVKQPKKEKGKGEEGRAKQERTTEGKARKYAHGTHTQA